MITMNGMNDYYQMFITGLNVIESPQFLRIDRGLNARGREVDDFETPKFKSRINGEEKSFQRETRHRTER